MVNPVVLLNIYEYCELSIKPATPVMFSVARTAPLPSRSVLLLILTTLMLSLQFLLLVKLLQKLLLLQLVRGVLQVEVTKWVRLLSNLFLRVWL